MNLLLLLLGVQRHYLWEISTQQSIVWNICGSIAILVLLWIVTAKFWSKTAFFIALWWSLEELQTVVCSTVYLFRPWTIKEGEAMCSSLLGFDLSSIGIACVVFLLWTMIGRLSHVK